MTELFWCVIVSGLRYPARAALCLRAADLHAYQTSHLSATLNWFRILFIRLVQRESNPYRFYSGGFTPMLCYCPWQYAEYYLRSMPRLNENPLRKNCKAHFGEECSRDFARGGRRLAGASQGRQVQKRRTGPPKCGTGSTPVGLKPI